MPPTRKTKKGAQRAAHYTTVPGKACRFDIDVNPTACVIYEYLSNQADKGKAPTMAQIRRHIPFAMGKFARDQEKSPFFPPCDSYILMMKTLFNDQYPGKIEKHVEDMIKDGCVQTAQGAKLSE